MILLTTALNGLVGYLRRVLKSLSILLNVVLGGQSNQTFSARNYQRKKNGKIHITPLIDTLFGKDHCVRSWMYWKVQSKW